MLGELGDVLSGLGESSCVQALHLGTLLRAVRYLLSDRSEELSTARAMLLERLTVARVSLNGEPFTKER